MGFAGQAVAVPVAAAGAEQPELEGEIGQGSPVFGLMAGMPSLHRIETNVLEFPEAGPGAAVFEVGGAGYSPRAVHQFADFSQCRKHLGDKTRLASTDVTIKRLVQTAHHSSLDERPADVRTAHRSPARLGQDIIHRDIHPHCVEPAHDFGGPARAAGPGVGKETFQSRRIGIQEVGEQVHLAPRRRHGKFAASDHPHAQPGPSLLGLGHPGHRIVISQRDRGKPEGGGPSHHLARGALSVRGRRMEMKINARSVVQRLYPVSGAVQAGCDMRK
jgi:hypothetical protein